MMTESIKAQIDSFVMGFYSIIPKSSIRYFKAAELELLLCGLPDIDHEDWRLNTEYRSCQVELIKKYYIFVLTRFTFLKV